MAATTLALTTPGPIGPAVAGVLIAEVGTGWVFLINAASFAAVLTVIALLVALAEAPTARAAPAPGDDWVSATELAVATGERLERQDYKLVAVEMMFRPPDVGSDL